MGGYRRGQCKSTVAITPPPRRISLLETAREPFRLLFPQAVLAGLVGVALWPLYFGHVIEYYPNLLHVRLMVFGFFGGFILGFLGTALPRMLSANPLHALETGALLGLHAAMIVAYTTAKLTAGDGLLLGWLGAFAFVVVRRLAQRRDTPPPGFVLVGLAFLCATAGAILALLQPSSEMDPRWFALQRLLSAQGFVLLPILGVGPFLLPRFFGLPSEHDFPKTLVPPALWVKKAGLALSAGMLIIVSFFIEINGWFRMAYLVRSITILVYFALEFPFARTPQHSGALGACLRVGFGMLLAGFVASAVWPVYRLRLMHLTLVGGFAVVTFVVATRVVFGHSGHRERLRQKNRWLFGAVGLMVLAMATRISGDFWPKILPTHYSYGAVIWACGVAVWAWKVLPKIREIAPE